MSDEDITKFKTPQAKLVESVSDSNVVVSKTSQEESTSVTQSDGQSEEATFSTSPKLLLGQVIGGHYEIESVLGEGGISIVYKARHMLLGTPAAIKFLLPGTELDAKAIMRFQREAQATAEIKHPSIAGIREFGIHKAIPYLVLEFVEGKSLAELLREEKTLEPKRALSLLQKIAEAISYAHAQKVVHRDLKPSNIMIQRSGDGEEDIKIIDFGIAKVLESEHSNNLTKTGDIFGTPSYMSPEQCQGKPVDYRSDVYAIGCVAYEMFSGSPPFLGSTPVELILKHLNDNHKPLKIKGIKGLNKVLDAALAKDPTYRYQSCDELRLDLDLLAENKEPLGKPRPKGKFDSKRFLKIATIFMLGFLAFYIWFLTAFQEGTIKTWTAAIEKEPNVANNYIERGRLYKREWRGREALADANKAVELAPKNFWAYKLRSETYTQLEEYENAQQDAAKAIECAPTEYRGYLARGTALYYLGRYDEAIADLDKSLDLNKETYIGNVWNNRSISNFYKGCSLNEQRHYKEALTAFNKSMQNIPARASNMPTDQDSFRLQILTERAKAYLGLKQLDAALADVQAALEIDPADPNAKRVLENVRKAQQSH